MANVKIYIVRSIATAAVLFAPFVVSAVSNQLNINQVVITTFGGGGIITTGIVTSLKISDIAIAPTSNSANITWNTDKPLRSRVRWGVTRDYESGELIKFDDGINHIASIQNLSPNTVYYLRVESVEDGIVMSWFTQTFTTLPISILPPREEVKPPARLAPPVPEKEEEELIIPTIIPKEIPEEEVTLPLEPEERVREVREVIGETVSRARDALRTYGSAVRGFFARIAVVIKTAFIFAADQLKGLFLKIR